MEYVGGALVGVLTESDDAHLFQPGHIIQSAWVTQYYLNFHSHPGALINKPRIFGVRNAGACWMYFTINDCKNVLCDKLSMQDKK